MDAILSSVTVAMRKLLSS